MSEFLEELKGAKKIAITGHVRPDGDCIGTCMAMYLYLQKNMPDTETDVYLESIRDSFECIKDVDKVRHSIDSKSHYDILLIIDCEAARTGRFQALCGMADKIINIDHHVTNPGSGDINFIDPEASASSELLYSLLDSSRLDEDIAKALYIGIIHDTGVLQYTNTRPATLRCVADLISYGFNGSAIIDETFYEKTYPQTLIMGAATAKAKLLLDGRIAYTFVDKAMMDEFGVGMGDLDGIINRLRYIKGVECAMFAYQLGDGRYKFSLRTSDRVDAAAISSRFGGGGHRKAAGFEAKGVPEDMLPGLVSIIREQLGISD